MSLKHCERCKAEGVENLVTHSTTDAVQTPDGWQETAPRYGCDKHKVKAMVTLIDGTVIPYETYHVN